MNFRFQHALLEHVGARDQWSSDPLLSRPRPLESGLSPAPWPVCRVQCPPAIWCPLLLSPPSSLAEVKLVFIGVNWAVAASYKVVTRHRLTQNDISRESVLCDAINIFLNFWLALYIYCYILDDWRWTRIESWDPSQNHVKILGI